MEKEKISASFLECMSASMKTILAEIETKFVPGTKIPKPESQADFVVTGWGVRRNERALVYAIPNHKTPTKPYRKGITFKPLNNS
jgi:hypothetical protein